MKRSASLIISLIAALAVSLCAVFCVQALDEQGWHVHVYESEIIKPADCETKGLIKFHCKLCGSEHTEAIAPKGHVQKIISAVSPTCTQYGYTEEIVCANCEKILKKRERIEKLPHDFVLVKVEVPSTCVIDGMGLFKCKNCAETQVMDIEKIDHNFQASNTLPTCEDVGLQGGSVCTTCGLVLVEPACIPALGHCYDICEKTAESTCVKEGEQVLRCSRCGRSERHVLPLKEHTPAAIAQVAPTCEKTGLSGGTVCSVCKKVLVKQKETPALGHSFSAWKTVKKAKCTESGKLQAKCKLCGALKNRPIPALGHSYEMVTVKASFNSNGSTFKKCKTCGKTENKVKIPKVSNVSLEKDSYVYNAKTKRPAVKIKNSEGKLLKSGTDYTVTYKNNKEIGTGEAVVKLKGKYSGTKTLDFTILPGKVGSVSAVQTTSSIKLSWNKVSGAQKYAVYTYNKSTKKYTRIDTVKTNFVTLKKLKSGTCYIYSVRAFSNGMYGERSSLCITATKCHAVTNVKLKVSGKKLNISWKKSAGASEYEIYACKAKDGKYIKLKTTTKTSAKVKLSDSVKYVKVRAVKKANGKIIYSSFSSAQKVPKG